MKNFTAIALLPFLIALFSCSTSKKIGRMAKNDVLENEVFVSAHTGISIYEPATGKYWFNYQGNKYFVPASNTKLPTSYAAMKYLGDSLTGIKYIETSDSLIVIAAGDPTFLHPDFPVQRVFDFLKNNDKPVSIKTSDWNDERWGSGWSWNDYSDDYAPERSAMPVYGNVLRLSGTLGNLEFLPGYFKKDVSINNELDKNLYPGNVHRNMAENNFFVTAANLNKHYTETPFTTSDSLLANLLGDTLHKAVSIHNADPYTKTQSKSNCTPSLLIPCLEF
jgi:D-alanyl-D-alanine carboxypeptidase/D-alanyl-D-alanine-endopeptidase (penicillin-binding protein 4)